MGTISWNRPGIRVVQGLGPNGVQCWVNWHIKEVPLGAGLDGPPLLGGEYTAYINGERVEGVFGTLTEAEAELERAIHTATVATPGG